MKPYGKVNLVSLLFIAAIAGAIYSVIMFSPAVVDNLDVQEEMAKMINQADRLSDDQIRTILVARLNQIGTHYEEQGDGTWAEVKGLGVTNDNLTVDRDTVSGVLTLRVDYIRQIKLKPSEAWTSLTFGPQKEGAVKR